jgi:hypothetical protein
MRSCCCELLEERGVLRFGLFEGERGVDRRVNRGSRDHVLVN